MLSRAMDARLSSLRGVPRVPCRYVGGLLRPSSLPSGADGVNGGNEYVQDALSEIIQIQVRKQEAKAKVLSDLEDRKEKLRNKGEELSSGLDDDANLDKLRLEMAAKVSLADSLEELRKLEEQVQGVRDQLREDRMELRNWEEASAAERSKGLFFRSLYAIDNDDEDEDGKVGSSIRRRSQAASASAGKSDAAEEKEKPSVIKLYLFTYLATVLFFALLIDLSGGAPQFGLDFIYVTLFAALGALAWSERQGLMDMPKDL